MLRSKNADRQLMDYDLNIYIPEELDEFDESYWDPSQWNIQVYLVDGNGHREYRDPIKLTADEIHGLGLNRDSYFKDEVDTWYGLQGFMLDYWDKMSDRLKEYFESLPKYHN